MRPDTGVAQGGPAERVVECDEAGRLQLRSVIGESPATLMSLEQLRRGLCRAYVLGSQELPEAIAVQPTAFPGDVSIYGNTAQATFALLRQLDGWEAADVTPDQARPVAEWLGWAKRRPVIFSREYFYALEVPVPALPDSAARMLTRLDLPLMEVATEPLQMSDWRFGSAAAMLAEGQVAGAVVGDELVAVAFTAAQGERYVDVGIVTRVDVRGRGLATAAASMLCAVIQAHDRIPVWGTSEENLASQRVAEKLGFRQVAQRVYLNLV